MDEVGFDALYEQEWSRLVGAVTFVCGDRNEAVECVQEAFVRAWEHRRRLDGDAAGWVRTVALRVAVSRWRKARSTATAWLRADGQRASAAGPEDLSGIDPQVWHALRSLPEAQREALVMHHVMDLSVDRISEITGSPAGTVKARLARGRAAMAARLTVAGTTSWTEGSR